MVDLFLVNEDIVSKFGELVLHLRGNLLNMSAIFDDLRGLRI